MRPRALVILCLLVAGCGTESVTTDTPEPPTRIMAPNGYFVDWQGTKDAAGKRVIALTNPWNVALHVWGVGSYDNYGEGGDLTYYSRNQPGGFDMILYPRSANSFEVTSTGGAGSVYHLTINIEPVQQPKQ